MNISNNDSPRTPQSAQLCSFVCSPIFRCNDFKKRSRGGISTNASPRSCDTDNDDGKGWILTPATQLRSFVKNVYDGVMSEFQHSNDEIEILFTATEIGLDEDTLYPTSFISSPMTRGSHEATMEEKEVKRKFKLSSTFLDDNSTPEADSTFLSLSESLLTKMPSAFSPLSKTTGPHWKSPAL